MPPKIMKEEPSDADAARSEFITKLSGAAETMRQFGNFAEALAKVVAKAPLDDPEVVAALQVAIDAIPAPSKKRKLALLTGTEEGGKRRRREKKPKDPNAPKAPPSAYILFQNEIRNVVREQNPDIQYRELMTLISQQWNGLPAEKKKPYFDRVSAAKLTHETELAKYNESNPNHVPSEGTSKTPRKEVQTTKPEKKPKSVPTKPAPKPVEASSDDGQSEGSEDESAVEKDVRAPSEDDSSDDDSDNEPTPPPAKKVKKADKRK